MKMIHRGEKGFTLIELLVVIAILGVIAAVVALNVAGFFGRGTLQAANTELHQAQTAIIAAMADAETNIITRDDTTPEVFMHWAGEAGAIVIRGTDGEDYDAADYVYGPFRAVYTVNVDPECEDHGIGQIYEGVAEGDQLPTGYGDVNVWGPAIEWDDLFMNWKNAD